MYLYIVHKIDRALLMHPKKQSFVYHSWMSRVTNIKLWWMMHGTATHCNTRQRTATHTLTPWDVTKATYTWKKEKYIYCSWVIHDMIYVHVYRDTEREIARETETQTIYTQSHIIFVYTQSPTVTTKLRALLYTNMVCDCVNVVFARISCRILLMNNKKQTPLTVTTKSRALLTTLWPSASLLRLAMCTGVYT